MANINLSFTSGEPVRIQAFGQTLYTPEWGLLQLEGDGKLVFNGNQTISLMMEPDEEPKKIRFNNVLYDIDPTLLADGPYCIKPPKISKYQGDSLIVERGIWISDEAANGIDWWDTGWYKGTPPTHKYSNKEIHWKGDKDKLTDLFCFVEVARDNNGMRTAASNQKTLGDVE